jgi:hypothetical protein
MRGRAISSIVSAKVGNSLQPRSENPHTGGVPCPRSLMIAGARATDTQQIGRVTSLDLRLSAQTIST